MSIISIVNVNLYFPGYSKGKRNTSQNYTSNGSPKGKHNLQDEQDVQSSDEDNQEEREEGTNRMMTKTRDQKRYTKNLLGLASYAEKTKVV